jgi:serine/threonine protein kinase
VSSSEDNAPAAVRTSARGVARVPVTHGAEPGSVFADKYKVEKVIGAGGMGVILSAVHMELNQRVAIKLLTFGGSVDPDRVGRFAREAKAAARIDSEHVVRILDYGAHASGAPFIVMEHLVGSDLGVTLKTHGALAFDDAIDFVIQACEGVAEAHRAGIVHRDLKPANLFLTRRKDGVQVVKVLDFGASKLTADCTLASDLSHTNAGTLIGSPRYMAPEQLTAAHTIDSRVDVYSLGATLYELLSGRPVFAAPSIKGLFTKILWDEPPSITQLRDDVPAALEAVLLRCMQKRPDDRYPTVKELVEALAAFAPPRSAALVAQIAQIGRPPASIAPPPKIILKPQIPTPASDHPATLPPSTESAKAGGKGHWIALGAVVGVAVLVLVVVLATLLRRGGTTEPAKAIAVAPVATLAAEVLPPDAPVAKNAAPGLTSTADAPTGTRSTDRPSAAKSSRHDATTRAPPKKTLHVVPSSTSTTKARGDLRDFENRK